MVKLNPSFHPLGEKITANRCIKNYKHESGDFLNYFNAAIAKEYRESFANNEIFVKRQQR